MDVYLIGSSGFFGPMTEEQAEFLRVMEYRRTGTGPNVCSRGIGEQRIAKGDMPSPTRDHPDAHQLASLRTPPASKANRP